MKITLKRDGEQALLGKHPYEGCEYAVIPDTNCPSCEKLIAWVKDGRVHALCAVPWPSIDENHPGCTKEDYEGPLKVRMPSVAIGHDTYTGGAECTRCRETVGMLTVQVDTLFGIEEDAAVLSGRCRVY
jgi:hypothetical protein